MNEENSDLASLLSAEFNKFITGIPKPALVDVNSQVESVPIPQKKENRKGNKTLPSRQKFTYWSPEDKLAYILANYDPESGEYVNSDRQWLLRAAKSYKCFTMCCDKNVQVFLSKHGKKNKNGKDNFTIGSVKGCNRCNSC